MLDDYRFINAVACLITLLIYLAYLKSGKYEELRVSVSLIALFVLYYGSVYAISFVPQWDTLILTSLLRPPFSIFSFTIGIFLIDLAWGEEIYDQLARIRNKIK